MGTIGACQSWFLVAEKATFLIIYSIYFRSLGFDNLFIFGKVGPQKRNWVFLEEGERWVRTDILQGGLWKPRCRSWLRYLRKIYFFIFFGSWTVKVSFYFINNEGGCVLQMQELLRGAKNAVSLAQVLFFLPSVPNDSLLNIISYRWLWKHMLFSGFGFQCMIIN